MPERIESIANIARAEVGTHEGMSSGHHNNVQKYSPSVPGLEWSQGQPWCATFVAWCAMKAGLAEFYPRTASCDIGYQWFKVRGQLSEYPAIGAQVFFGTPADLVHTGLVIGFDKDFVYTIEGNTNDTGSREGDGVYRKARRRRDAYVVAYGYPKIPGVYLKSADPKRPNAPVVPDPPKGPESPSITPATPSQPNVRAAIKATQKIKGPKHVRQSRTTVLDILKGLLK